MDYCQHQGSLKASAGLACVCVCVGGRVGTQEGEAWAGHMGICRSVLVMVRWQTEPSFVCQPSPKTPHKHFHILRMKFVPDISVRKKYKLYHNKNGERWYMQCDPV